MDAAKENTADQDPEQDRDPAEDSGLYGAVDRACARDRRKVMAQQDRRLGGNVVHSVLQFVGGSRT